MSNTFNNKFLKDENEAYCNKCGSLECMGTLWSYDHMLICRDCFIRITKKTPEEFDKESD